MAERLPFEKAQTYGLKDPEVVIPFYITAWFNGKTVNINDRPVSIASAYEPPLRQLCGDEWEPHFDRAHEQSTERGLFKSQSRGENIYIAGRRCPLRPSSLVSVP